MIDTFRTAGDAVDSFLGQQNNGYVLSGYREWEQPLPGQTKSSINISDGKFTGIDCDRTQTGDFTKDDKYELNF